jgi:GDP/UDP-N,N'-diacetylbacillosamine 2-epimerase (hydrolysing)
MRNILVVSTARSDFYLLLPLVEALHQKKSLLVRFCVIQTEAEAKSLDTTTQARLALLNWSRINRVSRPKSRNEVMDLHSALFREIVAELNLWKPEIVVLLGDRSEAMVAALASTLFGATIAHIHGGEKTVGSVDDNYRHAITKLSHIHFVDREEYANRVRQLGEREIHLVGSIGAENASRLKKFSKEYLENHLGTRLGENNFLLTLHPETKSSSPCKAEVEGVVQALTSFPDSQIIATGVNTDFGGIEIHQTLQALGKKYPNLVYLENLGSDFYLSLASLMTAVVGNSSSGVIEIPALGVPTVNLGTRQTGRTFGPTIISSPMEYGAVRRAVTVAKSTKFMEGCEEHQKTISSTPTTQKIADCLENASPRELFLKDFFDQFPNSSFP